MTSVVHVVETDEPGAWQIQIGPFRDPGLAEHVAAALEELANGGKLLNLAVVPSPVLDAIVDEERALTDGEGHYDIGVDAGKDGTRVVKPIRRGRIRRGKARQRRPEPPQGVE